ncbi:Protein F28H7.3 [Aphelenchoides avenae]|nr:Protein F28H7.3 [Aphelenchus avenae]
MLPLSAAAYSDHPEGCLKKLQPSVQVFQTYTVKCDSKNICFAYTAISHTNKTLIVSFRGSAGFDQVIRETIDSGFGERVAFYDMGTVGNYFGNAFDLLWKAGIQADVQRLTKRYPTYGVWVTGHSLGAALASLTAAAIVKETKVPSTKIQLITFGQPRVGDVNYALAHDALLPNSYRITHNKDAIAALPIRNPRLYYHHRQEIHYGESMVVGAPYIVCRWNEDSNCSDATWDFSMDDHRHYFEIAVTEYCDSVAKS